MRISVLINPKAGSVDVDLVEAKVRDTLFRCELSFCKPDSFVEMCDFLHDEKVKKTDYFIICGGDGTVNAALQCLLACSDHDLTSIPPITLVRSGTANDLAHEMGVSRKIEQAVHNILGGKVKFIDIIEVVASAEKKYMLTNGGVGIPALAAQMSNTLRETLLKASTCEKQKQAFQFLALRGFQTVRKLGPHLYTLMAMEAIRSWDSKNWLLELSIPGKSVTHTTAPTVLINNQPSIGTSYLPAPYTSNTDGTVNLLLSESSTRSEHIKSALMIRKGDVQRSAQFKTFELQEFGLKSLNPLRTLTFFGDGEILHKDVREVSVKCLHRGLPVVVAP